LHRAKNIVEDKEIGTSMYEENGTRSLLMYTIKNIAFPEVSFVTIADLREATP